jgi:peptidoglycan/LPS O-acetylase OafA/YrhL
MTGTASMAIPATIVAGIGGILYWQNATGQWMTWAYAWALIPGFAGLGTILAAVFGEGGWRAVSRGAETILVSLVMFAVFGSLFGGWALFGPFWPVLLIVLGLVMLVRAFVRQRSAAG